MSIESQSELSTRLKSALRGEFYTDAFTRGRYATDASIYQIMPAGVVVPKNLDDIQATIELLPEAVARRNAGKPLIPD